jgi:hypothetical protein
MAEAKQAWDEVGTMFGGLGLKLKMHFEQARAAEGEAGGPAQPGAEPSAEQGGGGPDAEELKSALRKLADALDGTFDAVGNAVRDPAVKDDVKTIGRALSDAFSATFAEVSDDLRRAFRRREGDDEDQRDDGGAAGGDRGA